MTKFAVAFEKSGAGCITTGKTLPRTRKRMHQAMDAHLQAMREDGDAIPEPSHIVDVLEVA